MCGIGVIFTGAECSRALGSKGPICLPHILGALQRRGLDSAGITTVYVADVNELDRLQTSRSCRRIDDAYFSASSSRHWTGAGNFDQEQTFVLPEFASRLDFAGSTLQLRGSHRVRQPLQDEDGNVLAYNGEVFGGLDVLPDENDTEVLLEMLGRCESSLEIRQVLSQVRGPWAVIYFKISTRTLWFGRDAFGRRSLLVHWPSPDDARFLLSSVAPVNNDYDSFSFWEELPCRIYSFQIGDQTDQSIKDLIKIHEWEDPVLRKLISWNRSHCSSSATSDTGAAEIVLHALKNSIEKRLVNSRISSQRCSLDPEYGSPVAVLFSGGIDSMILAALADRCLDQSYTIDLLNVSFEGSSAPDRITAIAGIDELRKISPSRKWRLVEVDETIGKHQSKILSLICPSQTYMDLNIGTALWCAAGGDGIVENDTDNRAAYKSEARVVLVGAGADEQCGGYLRYRTKFKLGGLEALAAEMRLDMQRLWKRNLGRDDRCIADHGKEARFPFLDEDVIRTLLDLPLEDVVDLREDIGIGDKKILRQVAKLLGLSQSAALPKRAIQFGSGIAKRSNRQNFGSNRAANKASAGSVKLGNLE